MGMGLPVLCLWLLLGGAVARPWTYDPCDAAAGPSAWRGGCQARGRQSPVNLCGAKGHSFDAIDPRGYEAPVRIVAANTSLQFNVRDKDPPVFFLHLGAVVGHSNASDLPQWQLAQVHFHVGPAGSTEHGSEHYLQGQSFPLEVHLLHFNNQCGATLESAVRNSAAAADVLLVVSILFRAGDTDTLLTKAVAAALSTQPQVHPPLTVHLGDSFDADSPFYTYAGSLTTPPCPHPVTWLVLQRTKTVTPAALAVLQAALPGSSRSQRGNARPLQSLGGRVIYSSAGPTAPCRPVEQPQTPCHGGEAVVADPAAQCFRNRTTILESSLTVQPDRSRIIPPPLSLVVVVAGVLLVSFAIRAAATWRTADSPPSNGPVVGRDQYGDHVAIPLGKRQSSRSPSYGTLSHGDRLC